MDNVAWWRRTLPARRLWLRRSPGVEPTPPHVIREPFIQRRASRTRSREEIVAEPGLVIFDRVNPRLNIISVDIQAAIARALIVRRLNWESKTLIDDPLVTMPDRTAEAPGPTIEDRLCALLLVPLERLLPSADSALDWTSPLMPFQLDGVRYLMASERALLADDMGLGKTVQVIAAMRILIVQRAIEQCLVIVPASLIDQWRGELNRWAPELRVVPVRGLPADRKWQWQSPAHVTLAGYETFRADFGVAQSADRLRQRWDLVVIDEAQKIKNPEAEISLQVKHVSRQRSWALTGTPLENSLDDLISIMQFVDHDRHRLLRGFAPAGNLFERHRALQLRRRKADVLVDLPPKQVIPLRIPLLAGQLAAYQRAERDGIVQLRELGSAVRIEHVLELITRLKQLCNIDPVSGESAKLEDIHERLGVLVSEGHRALVFSQYTDERFGVNAAARYLAEFNPLTYTGSMTSRERQAVIDRFRQHEEHSALILSLRAGGVGLNLQEASYVFHLDRWWNPAVERQAEDRSHRMGQQYPVTVIKYTSIDTIEERIDALLVEKQRLFDQVIDDVTVDVSSALSQDELFGLFGLETVDRIR